MLGELDLSVYRSTESYTKQIAVSYNGVQLIAEELSQMFVTDSHRQLGLLDCGDITVKLMFLIPTTTRFQQIYTAHSLHMRTNAA